MGRRKESELPDMSYFVRQCPLVVSIINIVIWSLVTFSLIYSLCTVETRRNDMLFAIFIFLCVGFIVFNIKLKTAIFERNIAPMVLWLQVYIILFLAVICLIGILILFISPLHERHLELQLIIIILLIIEGFLAFSIYMVYQCFHFQTKSLNWALNRMMDAETFTLTQQPEI